MTVSEQAAQIVERALRSALKELPPESPGSRRILERLRELELQREHRAAGGTVH